MSPVMTRILRWSATLAAGLLGFAVGAVGSFEHRASATWLSTAWPTGLLLSLGGFCGLLLGLGELTGIRIPPGRTPSRVAALGTASAGWLIAVVWLTYVGPPFSFAVKGDVILANDWKSMSFLIGGMVLATLAVYRSWVADLAVRLGPAPGGAGRSKE
jgi:hypothetical protein